MVNKKKHITIEECKEAFHSTSDSLFLETSSERIIEQLKSEADAASLLCTDDSDALQEVFQDNSWTLGENLTDSIMRSVHTLDSEPGFFEEFEHLVWRLSLVSAPCCALALIYIYFSVSLFDFFGFTSGSLI